MGVFCFLAFWEYHRVLSSSALFNGVKRGSVLLLLFLEAGVEFSGLCLMILWFISDGLGKWFSF